MKALREKFTCALIILLNVSGIGYALFGKFPPPVSQPVEQQQQTPPSPKETRTATQICAAAPATYKKAFNEEWPQYVQNSRRHHEQAAIKALQQYGEYRARWQEFVRQCKKEISGWQSPINQDIVERAIRIDCEDRISDFLPLFQKPVSESQKDDARKVIQECTNQITAGWHIPDKIRQSVNR